MTFLKKQGVRKDPPTFLFEDSIYMANAIWIIDTFKKIREEIARKPELSDLTNLLGSMKYQGTNVS